MRLKSILYRALTIANYRSYMDGGDVDRKFSWKDALLDALIIAGWNFFGTLMGIHATQIITDPVKTLTAAAIAAGFGFFSTLAAKRGLSK